MNDEKLLKMKRDIDGLKDKDVNYVNGFSNCFDIFSDMTGDVGTELQSQFLLYLKRDLKEIHFTKLEHGTFKHVVK